AQQRQAQQRQAQQRSEQRRRTAEESGQRTFTEQVGQPLGRIDVEQRPVTTQSHTDEQMSVEDQRLEQLEQLQNRLGAHVTQLEDVDAESFTLSQSDERMPRMSHNTSQQPVTTSNLSKRFNRQGLV